jgi:glycosyltransferase involved in cell wall biosynthesis
MRFLIHGNAPHVKTGYGVQVAQLVERLQADGHDVAVSCSYGQQGGTATWRGVQLYPCGYEINGNDVIHHHAHHWFGGDPAGGWIITLIDVWALQNPLLADFNVAAWVPVDHFPAPPGVIDFFKRTGATPVTMSRFGERLLFDVGLDPVYVPLSVDTTVMKPTPSIAGQSAREFLDIPPDAFVVGMVAMNKGWARDRKGFNEAFRAFGAFWQSHPEAVLYLHSEKFGAAEGMNLVELLQHASVPPHAVRWVDQYAYRMGVPAEMMAATYTAMDVLLAPSHGEGFCVPLIEAQACGTPVIATDATAQPELVGAGWLVGGQPEWDPAQHASYVCPSVTDIIGALESAYAADREAMTDNAVAFANRYDSDIVFDGFWRPLIDSLAPVDLDVPYPRPPMDRVDVIVPAMRPENMERVRSSFDATNDGTAQLVVVVDADSTIPDPYLRLPSSGTTYAQKVNAGVAVSNADWVFIAADDVEFTPGWIEAARKLSEQFDVIGTNDTAGAVKHPDIAAGQHADHFFVRRAYIDELGASLDGPGVLAPTAYKHWFTDKEIIGLARARRVFTPCLDSVVVHHHPGYDGREDRRHADPVYMTAVNAADADAKTFHDRAPLIGMQRAGRAK